MNKTTAVILLSLAGATFAPCANAQFENEQAFKPVAGRWKTKEAKFTSLTNEAAYEKRTTNWKGKMFGLIKPSGQLLFKGENGCILSGMASPFASVGLWSVEGQLEGCKVTHFNQKVFGNIRKEGSELVVDLTNLPFSVGSPPVGYYLKARMTVY